MIHRIFLLDKINEEKQLIIKIKMIKKIIHYLFLKKVYQNQKVLMIK
jgi:hypothetical protein